MRVLLINRTKTEPVRRLETDPDVDLVAITEAPFRLLYRDTTEVHIVDDITDVTAVGTAALAALRHGGLDFVVTPLESALASGAYLRSMLGLPGDTFDTAAGFFHKYTMKQRLRAAGVPVADFALAHHLAEAAAVAPGWPAVIKPVTGFGGLGVRVADNPTALAALRKEHPQPLIVERHVDMISELHCDGVVVDGKARFISVCRYDTPLLAGGARMTASYTLPDGDSVVDAMRQLHHDTVTALGMIDGVTHMQVFDTPDGFLVGEISSRPGGGGITDQIAHHHSVNQWDAFIATATGRPTLLDPNSANGFTVRCMLPARPGVVCDITDVDTLASLPGVVSATLTLARGDVVQGPALLTHSAGTVLATVDELDAVGDAIAMIDDAFHIVQEEQ